MTKKQEPDVPSAHGYFDQRRPKATKYRTLAQRIQFALLALSS